MDRQFGTPQTIDALTRISQKFSQQNPGFQVGIGDMSWLTAP
jgi:murein endopeptidase